MTESQGLAASSRQALNALVSLDATLKTRSPEHHRCLDDIFQRYRLWAGNIGALHELKDQKSLEYRLRAAPRLQARFQELLRDVRDDLDELGSLLDGNGEGTSSGDSEFDTTFGGIIDTLNESVRSLFKTSGIARKAVTRDRYAMALKKIDTSQVSREDVDFDLIGDLFPRLRLSTHDWLRKRLAKANNLRRRYIHYCDMHQMSVQAGNTLSPQETIIRQAEKAPLFETDEARTEKSSQFAMSTATTVIAAAFESTESGREDVESIVSAFSYATDSMIPMRYRVIDLEDVNDGQDEFICPYCRKEITCTSQDRWKNHVLSDIKAYVCLDKDCDARLFENSRSWMHHQLSIHLTSRICPYCEHDDSHNDLSKFKTHLREIHGSRFHEAQIGQICKISEQEPDAIPVSACPFCDWRTKLEYSKPSPQHRGSEITVSLQRYRRHIGSHMEQAALAIFAVEDTEQQQVGNDEVDSDDALDCGSDRIELLGSVSEETQPQGRVETSNEALSENVLLADETEEKAEMYDQERTKDEVKREPCISVPVPYTITGYFDQPGLSMELTHKLSLPYRGNELAHAVIVTGRAGSGKTQLVIHHLELYGREYDTILWLHVGSVEQVQSSFQRCFEALGFPTDNSTSAGQVALQDVPAVKAVLRYLRSAGPENRWIVVMDEMDDLSSGVRKIIPHGQAGSVIIISRDEEGSRLLPGGCDTVMVGEQSQVINLVKDADLLPLQEMENLVKRLGTHPLAISQAGAFIRKLLMKGESREVALRRCLAEFEQHQDRLFQNDKSGSHHTSTNPGDVVNYAEQPADVAGATSGLMEEKMLQEKEVDDLEAAIGLQILKGNKEGWDPKQPSTLDTVNMLGSLYMSRGMSTEAEKVYLRALLYWTKPWGPEHLPNLAEVFNQLGELYARQGKMTEAEKMFMEALTGREKLLGSYHPLTLESLTQLTEVLRKQGNHELAEQTNRRLLEGHDRLFEEDGSVLQCINDLAMALQDQGKIDAAEEMYRRALEGSEKMLGRDHPTTLTSIEGLARLLRDQGKYDAAEKMYQRMMDVRLWTLGEQHPDTLRAIANIADIYVRQGLAREADELERKVMEGWLKVLGKDHPETLTAMANVAESMVRRGLMSQAEELQIKVMEGRLKILGQHHPDTITIMADLASTYSRQLQIKKAERLLERVMETRSITLGEDHPDTLRAMTELAKTYQSREPDSRAEKLLERVVGIRSITLGEDHPDTLRAMTELAKTYQSGEPDSRAEKLLERVVGIRSITLGEDHPDTLRAMTELAKTYQSREPDSRAEKLLERVVGIRSITLGEDHPDTLRAMTDLASTYRVQGRENEAKVLETRAEEIRGRTAK